MEKIIRVGDRLPMSRLAELDAGVVRAAPAAQLFANKRAVIVGVPGAFTPVCTKVHVPKFVEMAGSMLASGFDMIAVVANNDPWTLAEWAAQIDPMGRLRFFSDGNSEFGHACGLTERVNDLFLGLRLRRFSMIVDNAIVDKLSIESSILDVGCSSAELCLPPVRAA